MNLKFINYHQMKKLKIFKVANKIIEQLIKR